MIKHPLPSCLHNLSKNTLPKNIRFVYVIKESFNGFRLARKFERPVAQLIGVSGKSVRVMTPIYRGILRGVDVKTLRSETLLS